jgi:hypothetical protein
MDGKRLEIPGREGVPIGVVEVIPAGTAEGEYKIVLQLERGYQVLALRSEMTAGRISGIIGRPSSVPRPTPSGALPVGP